MSKIDLARQLGTTATAVTLLEEEGTAGDDAATLAHILGFPADFFLAPWASPRENCTSLFRAGRKASATRKKLAHACGDLGFEVDQYIADRFTLPSLNLPELSELDPRQAARELRYHWAVAAERPLPNLVQLCESQGVHVYGLPPVAHCVDAFSDWFGPTPLIFLARHKTPERTRFDLTHELGHLVLHSAASSDKDPAMIEREADAFASEFLLPQLTILNNVRTNASLSTVLQIRDAFHVSATATAVAINEAGLFSDSAFEFTMRHLSRHGYRTGEPGGLQHQERSRIFPTVFDRSRPKHLTIKQLEAELHIPAEDIHALTFGSQMISLNLKRHEQAESLQ